jgi:hypothetical protein
MASLMHPSFKFQSSADHTRHLIPLPKCYTTEIKISVKKRNGRKLTLKAGKRITFREDHLEKQETG